jgi:molybdate transport system substrate-binding protein
MKSSYTKTFSALFIVIGLISSVAGCSGNTNTITTTTSTMMTSISTQVNTATSTHVVTSIATPSAVTLNISAAASLTDSLKAFNTLYSQIKNNVTIVPNFAASGTLQKQIEEGAPADIFISAAAAQMNNLANEGLIDNSTRKNLLNNKVVLVVPSDSTLSLSSFKDLTGEKVKKIAIGDPKSVPAGTYAQQAFDEMGITSQVTGKYVMGADVKAVLSYVESGNVDAGIVYSTDALTSKKVKIVASAPDDINAKVVYPVAVVKTSKYPNEALDYENFLFLAGTRETFEKYGFVMAAK